MVLQENVSAISTPSGVGGVAIIRISGETPLAVLSKMFRPTAQIAVTDFQPFRMYTGVILADGFEDYGMAVYFRAPKSYTGEHVVEIHCHGGIAIQRGILEKTFQLGCRPAGRGEFTRRAILNGKLSLSSSEGLIEMIHAESRAGVVAGYSLYREKLYDALEGVRKDLTFALASLNAQIDYPEEGLEELTDGEITAFLTSATKKLSALSETYQTGSFVKNGVKVALLGKPNAGKSSLLNRLIGRERAIVTEIAGTTRDVVEGETEMQGVRFLFSDTAGIRDTQDTVERMGVTLSKKVASQADIALFLTDGIWEEEDESLLTVFRERETEGKKNVVILNKTDLPNTLAAAEEISVRFGVPVLSLSAKTGDGVATLKTALASFALSGQADPEVGYLTERRHYDAVKTAIGLLETATQNVGFLPCDLIAADVEEAWRTIGEITGATAPEEVIDEIFSKFCVGK